MQTSINRTFGWILIAIGALIVIQALPGHHHGWELAAVFVEFCGAFLLGTTMRSNAKKAKK